MSVIKDAEQYLTGPSAKTYGNHDDYLRRVLARAKELEIALYAIRNSLPHLIKDINTTLEKK